MTVTPIEGTPILAGNREQSRPSGALQVNLPPFPYCRRAFLLQANLPESSVHLQVNFTSLLHCSS